MAELGKDAAPTRGASEAIIGVPQVVEHIRRGRVITGEPVRPYRWLEYATKPKLPVELNVEKVFEGCTFKSIMSLVVGEWLSKNLHYRLSRIFRLYRVNNVQPHRYHYCNTP